MLARADPVFRFVGQHLCLKIRDVAGNKNVLKSSSVVKQAEGLWSNPAVAAFTAAIALSH